MITKNKVALSRLAALTGRPWFWAAAVAVLFGVPLARGLTQGPAPSPPPMLGSFPAFALPAEDGSELKAADLHGRAFIADLLCAACPQGQERPAAMSTLQHRTRNLGDAVRLLSFSEDLDAAALRQVRLRHAAGQRWTLLAGAPPAAIPLFERGEVLLLVDGRMRIRGRYQSHQAGEIDRLLRDAALVTAYP